MTLVRKKDPTWFPSENDGLQVGDTIDVTDYRRLIELGMADLVDESGNILPLPGTVFVCGICFSKIDDHGEYVEHVLTNHSQVKTAEKVEPKETIEIKPKVVDKMAKARATRKKKEVKA